VEAHLDDAQDLK